MKFGMFEEFHVRDGEPQSQAFDEHFHQVDMAEKMGLDSVWLAEYHFAPERSVLASPLQIGSIIAARTQRITIGLSVAVVPLTNPIRLAEEAAIMDHVSKGRFIFGIGRSGLTQFYNGFSMDYSESRDRFFEGLEVVTKAWTNESFSHEGKFWNFHDVTLVPKPYQKPHPPINVAVVSPESYVSTGTLGHSISFFPMAPMPELQESLKKYRDALKKTSHPGSPEVWMRIPAYVGETAEKARSEPQASAAHQQEYDARVTVSYAPSSEFRKAMVKMATEPYEEQLQGILSLYGTPEYVTERIQAYEENFGISGLILELNHGGQIPYERVLNSMRLLSEKVMPKFK